MANAQEYQFCATFILSDNHVVYMDDQLIILCINIQVIWYCVRKLPVRIMLFNIGIKFDAMVYRRQCSTSRRHVLIFSTFLEPLSSRGCSKIGIFDTGFNFMINVQNMLNNKDVSSMSCKLTSISETC